jgi:redox-sensitive bicupin YhaK (pirin superfamily)
MLQFYLAEQAYPLHTFKIVLSGCRGSKRKKKMANNGSLRKVTDVIEPVYVMEGAGVRLRRSIAGRRLDHLDPFLLFDHFGSDDPQDYLAGFPMHPHRGIETVTYMLAGRVRHSDSLGNSGEIRGGDAQWMTSGSGILHEEMPQPVQGRMEGFQLWVNLPARLKMSPPRYQDVNVNQIPTILPGPGVSIRLVAGQWDGTRGPVTEIAANPGYLDATLQPGARFNHEIPSNHTAFAYLFAGGGNFCGTILEATRLAVFSDGDSVEVLAGEQGARFLLISGLPLGEPIARYGPFVMNTPEEIDQALQDLRDGTFVK